MHCSEQDQINRLESKVDSLLRRLCDVENELNELKNLNSIVSGIETDIKNINDSVSKLDTKAKRLFSVIYQIETIKDEFP